MNGSRRERLILQGTLALEKLSDGQLQTAVKILTHHSRLYESQTVLANPHLRLVPGKQTITKPKPA